MRSHYVTGEHLLVRTRAHPSVLIRPAWNLVLWATLSGFISGLLSSYALPEFLRSSATTLTTIALGLIAIGVFLSVRSEEHTSELQSRFDVVCRVLLEKKKY